MSCPRRRFWIRRAKPSFRALGRIGVSGVSDVRQGKRFELEVDDSVTADDLDKVAATLLANTVIEDYEVVGLEVK